MQIIKSVLREELANSQSMKSSYESELARLPKGSLIKKSVKGHEYYYIVKREGGKVSFGYIGKEVSPELKEQYDNARKYRAHYRRLLSQTNKQIKYLKGILRDKKSE